MYKNMVLVYSLVEPLRYFADQMKEAAKKRGIECYQADCRDEKTYTAPEFYSFLQRPGVFMMTFNGSLVNLNNEQGDNIWKKYEVPVYSSVQDHPRNYDSFLLEPQCDLHVLSLDKNHIEFIKRFFPKVKYIKFWPNGGTEEAGNKPYETRTTDVIYMGNCQEKIAFPQIPGLPEDGGELFMYGIRYLFEHPEASSEEAVYSYLNAADIMIDEANLYKLMVGLNVTAYIEFYVRRYYKLTCMKALDDAGIHVDIYGEKSWLDDKIVFSDNIHIHERIPNKDLNMLLGDAKISLCFLPWHKKGCSEKALDSMLNGAVCVCDRNEYLERNYHDSENIIFFDLNNPAQLAADIRWILDNPESAAKLARNGRETALLHDTWDKRFDQILDSQNENEDESFMNFNLEEEVRSGYLVDAKMKKVWKVELDMLVLFDKFCKENGLTYFMDFGTLLGAVRHKGFIPWDDDMDVTMPRPDYQKFLELAPAYFSHPYFVQNYHTDHNDNRVSAFSRLRNDNTTMIEASVVADANYHQGIFIDIFPLDIASDVYGGKEVPEIISNILELWTATFNPKDLLIEIIEGKEPKFGLDTIIDILGMPYEERLTLLENLLNSCYDSLDEINVFSKMFTTPPCKKEWYADVIRLPFENYEFNAPAGYHEILTARYGNYHEPKMFTSDHSIGILDPDRPYTEYLEPRQ